MNTHAEPKETLVFKINQIKESFAFAIPLVFSAATFSFTK